MFGRDCRVALCAPRNDRTVHSPQCTVHSFGRGTLRGAFPCLVEIAASRFRAPRNDNRGVRAPRNKSNDNEGAGVPVFGKDCRVALRAPRNDKRGAFRSHWRFRNNSNDWDFSLF
ncbi:MAG: hypothetical protein LBL66_01980 [Clostridiales bacterium]|nr:hypothetical protein [Clostridiales bacterium]